MHSSILFAALTLLLSWAQPFDVQQRSSQLSESWERSANETQPPEQVIELLGIRPGMTVGEVGAGRGRVTLHVAVRVGAGGKVFANDIDSSSLEYLKLRCEREGLKNVETILGLPEDARLPVNRLDLVYMTWVYHHVDNPVPLLKSLLPSLKPWAVVALVEPDPARTEPKARALTRERVGAEAKAAGFSLDSILEGRLKSDNIFILRPMVPDTPESRDSAKVRALWETYLAWIRSPSGSRSLKDYAVSLESSGVPADEIRRRLKVLRGQFTEQPEGIEMIYNAEYGKPLTGDPAKDGFKTAPNNFLMEAVRDVRPHGKALDVGAGMGRNAVYLGRLGWDVTGIDLSSEGLAMMRAAAEKAGLKVAAVKTSYQDFDFGKSQWALVAMILSWAPVEDPAFFKRLKDSVAPAGLVVFEHVLQRRDNPFPPGVHAPEAGALRELFKDFEILVYREEDDYGDWGGPPVRHVRMIARKKA